MLFLTMSILLFKFRTNIRILKNEDKVKEYYGYEFNTFIFRSFNWIYDMFYCKGKKNNKCRDRKVFNIISFSCLNYGGLANPGVRISTYNFHKSDV